MNMKNDDTLKHILKKKFGVDLPIKGGHGNSLDDAIIIDKVYEDWSDVMYTCLRLINRLFNRSWKLVKQTRLEQDGRTYDQVVLEVNGDSVNYYTFYFDVTDHKDNTKLFFGGTAWPDDILNKNTVRN